MSTVKTIQLAHLPPEYPLFVCLFTNVTNAPFLRQQLIQGNSEFEYAFIDASHIVSVTHLLAAAFRAVNDLLNNRLRSRNVHSEIVFSLGVNNNIAESFKRFGIADSTNNLLAVKVGGFVSSANITAESVRDHLLSNVKGTPIALSEDAIDKVADLDSIRKAYKLGGRNAPKRKGGIAQQAHQNGEQIETLRSGNKDSGQHHVHSHEEREKRKIEVAILGMMALKGS